MILYTYQMKTQNEPTKTAASQQTNRILLEDNRGKTHPLQAKKNTIQPKENNFPQAPIQKNNTGLPDKLKTGIENLSGVSMDHVKVHYNSAKPAQLNAHAYAQGSQIHIAPGQEKHLPHEAWHVVQQAQGRVKPTMQMKTGVPVNDDAGLEKEADVMGARALTQVKTETVRSNLAVASNVTSPFQLLRVNAHKFIKEKGLGIGDSHEDVIKYLSNERHPVEMRDGLRVAWNIGQRGRFVIPEGNPRGELSDKQRQSLFLFMAALAAHSKGSTTFEGSDSSDEDSHHFGHSTASASSMPQDYSDDDSDEKHSVKSKTPVFKRTGHTASAHGLTPEKSQIRASKTDAGFNGRWKNEEYMKKKIKEFYGYLKAHKLPKDVYFVRCDIPLAMGCADDQEGREHKCDGFFIKMTSMGSSMAKWKFSTCHPRMESTLGGDINKINLP